MTKNTTENSFTTPPGVDILAVTERLYGLARSQLATGFDVNGQAVCQEDFAIVNRARKAIDTAKK